MRTKGLGADGHTHILTYTTNKLQLPKILTDECIFLLPLHMFENVATKKSTGRPHPQPCVF